MKLKTSFDRKLKARFIRSNPSLENTISGTMWVKLVHPFHFSHIEGIFEPENQGVNTIHSKTRVSAN
tara:strand:- start:467 stop:667 length:201 start_codon:yes stop_codon:yes gene_type:complete